MDEGIQKSSWKGDDHRTLSSNMYSTASLMPHGQDSTFEFEKRRNVPVRYNRELVQTTIKAMKRVGEIRQRREHAFWKNRYVMFSATYFIQF